jgi:hypothetical protein
MLLQVLVIGLGGGLLPMFLHHHFDVMDVTTVELDKDIKDVAVEFFGFQERGAASRVIVADGLEVVRGIASTFSEASEAPTEGTGAPVGEAVKLSPHGLGKQNMIVIDVDCKDMSQGMPFPPKVRVCAIVCASIATSQMWCGCLYSQEFIEPEFLSAMKASLLPGGIVVLNVACRTKPLFEGVLAVLKAAFSAVFEVPPTV